MRWSERKQVVQTRTGDRSKSLGRLLTQVEKELIAQVGNGPTHISRTKHLHRLVALRQGHVAGASRAVGGMAIVRSGGGRPQAWLKLILQLPFQFSLDSQLTHKHFGILILSFKGCQARHCACPPGAEVRWTCRCNHLR